MKSLTNPADASALRLRLVSVEADDARLWGSMTVGEMLCHVREAYLAVIESRPLTVVRKSPLPQPVVKFGALYLPVEWPHGVPTVAELHRGQPGTLSADFAADHASALAAFDRFCIAQPTADHSMFGAMTVADWMRWGFLHADHHLRQFGR